jgi:hypothetical protein
MSSTDKITPKQRAFYQRRYATLHNLEQQANRGEIPAESVMPRMREKGYLPGGSAYKKPVGLPGFAAKTIGETAASFAYAPVGVYDFGRAVALDERDAVKSSFGAGRHATGGHGQQGSAPMLPRTRAMLSRSVGSIAGDFEHPLRHPGYALVDALSLASAGVGVAAKVSAASRAATVAREAGRSVPVQVGKGAYKLVVAKPPKTLAAAGAIRMARRGKREYTAETSPQNPRRAARMERTMHVADRLAGLFGVHVVEPSAAPRPPQQKRNPLP